MKRLVLILSLIVVGCATQTRHPVSGPPLTAVTEDEVGPLLDDLRLDLKDVSLAQIGGKSPEVEIADGQLELELPASALFEQGNGQVRTEALRPLAAIAQDIAARGGCVVHVIGLSEKDDDLIERRAASIADDFVHHGIAASRLRFESRLASHEDRIVVVLKPVIIGQESPAWIPPVLGE